MVMLFKDFGKTANNVLSDDYDFNRKLKIKTKTENGVALTTEGSMSAANKSILAKVSSSFKHSSGINISKLQITTHGRLIGEADITNAFVDNLKLSFKMEDGSLKNQAGLKYKQVGKVGAEYKAANFSTTAEADFSNNTLNSSAAFHYQQFVVGGTGSFALDKSALSDHNVGVAFINKDFNATLVTKKKMGVVSASFHHRPCGKLIYAAVMDYDVNTSNNSLSVGTRYNTDPSTTFCSKINSDGLVSLACIQKIQPKVTLTTCAHVDVKNLEGESHKFGLGLTLG